MIWELLSSSQVGDLRIELSFSSVRGKRIPIFLDPDIHLFRLWLRLWHRHDFMLAVLLHGHTAHVSRLYHNNTS